jgi:hypothetical protein
MISICFIPVTNAYAATPLLGKKYQNGVGNITAWLNYNSGVGYWQIYITSSANNWMYTGWSNPIYITFVSSNYGSNLDFHSNGKSYFGGSTNTLAVTKFFNSSGVEINPASSNWFYAEVHINDDAYKRSDFTNSQAHGTTRHEIGHALGLAHYNSNPNSIMCQTSSGRVVQSVQKIDNDAINILY